MSILLKKNKKYNDITIDSMLYMFTDQQYC